MFYDNEEEQKALFEFLGKHMKFKTGGQMDYSSYPEISWATTTTAPYTINTVGDLSGVITLNNTTASNIDTTTIEKTVSNSIKSNPREVVASLKLDNSSDEGGYSGITAHVPHKTK